MQKVKFILTGLFFCLTLPLAAQKIYIINNDTLQLQREVKGPLSLFWTEDDLEYRYFVQKEKRMVELLNPEGNGKFREQLSELTTEAKISTRDVKFVLYSLRHFTNTYNAIVQEDYVKNESTKNILQRISIFTGLSNNI